MKATVNKTLSLRAAMTLLAVVFTTLTAWADSDVTVSTQLYNNATSTYLESDFSGTACSNEDSYASGAAVTLTAEPAEGYKFKTWRVIEGSASFANATDATTTFTMPSNEVKVAAVFELKENYNCVITKATPDDGLLAQVSEDGLGWSNAITLTGETSLYLKATPSGSWHFMGWQVEGSATIGNAQKEYTSLTNISGIVIVTAPFSYILSTEASPAAGGTVEASLDNTVWGSTAATTEGKTVYLKATPNTGYVFKEWQSSSDVVTINDASSATTTIMMSDEDATMTAVFDVAPGYHSVSGTVSAGEGSILFSKDNSVWNDFIVATQGETVYYMITPAAGYSITSRQYAGTQTHDASTITMDDRAVTLSVSFGEKNNTIKMADPSNGSAQVSKDNTNWSDAVEAKMSETVYMKATPANDYWFREWQIEGSASLTYPNCPTTTITDVKDDATITAVFQKGLYVVTTLAADVTVNGTKVYVTMNEGYYLKSVTWVSVEAHNGTESITPYTLNLSGEGYFEAPKTTGVIMVNYGKTAENVTVQFDLKDHGDTAPASQTVRKGDKVVRPATDPVADGYTFLGWFTNTGCTNRFDFDSTLDFLKEAKTLTLYAGWIETSKLSGNCGTGVTWEVNKSTGSPDYDQLFIHGTGDMDDYKLSSRVPWYLLSKYIEHVYIDEGIVSIGNNSLRSLENMTTIHIPNSVTTIGEKAFCNCKNLKTLIIPNSIINIEKSAFFGCSGVTELTIDLETIKKDIVSGFKGLKTLTIGNNVTTIEKNAFASNKNLTKITIGEKVQTIGANAFKNLKYVTSDITLPASVTEIGTSAFENIANKKGNPGITITTGSGLETMRKNAFKNANAILDMRQSQDITEFIEKSTPLSACKRDIILPSSVNKIAKFGITLKLVNKKPVGTIYIDVPTTKILTVNGEMYPSENISSDRKADIMSYYNLLSKKDVLTLATMDDPSLHVINITTTYTDYTDPNNPVEKPILDAYKYTLPTENTEQTIEVINKAREGETVVLSWGGEHVPAGKYISGFSIKGNDNNTVVAKKCLDTEDYTFIMPTTDVNISAVFADQYEYQLDLTAANAQVEVPQMLQAMLGQHGYYVVDPATQRRYLDLNLDGNYDLELLEPEPEEEVPAYVIEDEDNKDPFADKYSVKRLAGADDVTVNSKFSFTYPFPLPFNGVLIKLNENNQEEQMATIHSLYDHNNVEELDKQTCHVQLTQRTLYKDGDWNTLCLPFDVTDGDNTDNVTFSGTPLAGAEARTLSSATVNGTTLNLTFGNPVTTLSAGVPYIIKWTAAQQNIIDPIFMNVTIDKTHHDYDNKATGDLRVRFMGTYQEMTFYLEDKSVLLVGENNQLFYPSPTQQNIDDGVYPNIKPFRAYFKIGNDNATAREFTDINLNFGEETTSLNEELRMKNEEFAAAAEWYTLDGRKLEKQPTKAGLYLYGKRKVLVGDKR